VTPPGSRAGARSSAPTRAGHFVADYPTPGSVRLIRSVCRGLVSRTRTSSERPTQNDSSSPSQLDAILLPVAVADVRRPACPCPFTCCPLAKPRGDPVTTDKYITPSILLGISCLRVSYRWDRRHYVFGLYVRLCVREYVRACVVACVRTEAFSDRFVPSTNSFMCALGPGQGKIFCLLFV